jgi:ferredoxin
MKIRLDEVACTGHGRCYALAPAVFDADDQGHCVIRHDDVPAEHASEARAAVANCPEDALTIDE